MEGNVNLTFSDGSVIVGEFELTPTNFIIYEVKSSPLWVMFGALGALIGHALGKREKVFKLNIHDIEKIEIKKYKLKKDGCFITTTSGETYVALFNHAEETIGYLQRAIAKIA